MIAMDSALQQRLIDLDADILSGWKRPAFTGWRCMRSLIEQEIAVVVFQLLQIHAYRKSGIQTQR